MNADYFAIEQRPIVAAHLQACAHAEDRGVFKPDAAVLYDDHGTLHNATVVSVTRYADGRLRGYVLDVEGIAPKPVRMNAAAYEVQTR